MPHTANIIPLHQTLFSGKMPTKPRNKDVRSREYPTQDEVAKLINITKKTGRHKCRDAAAVLLMYRHGLRVSELVALKWDQIDLKQGLLHVRRNKNGTPSTHPLGGQEIRDLRRIQRDYTDTQYVFVTERKTPLTTSGVRKIMARAGTVAGFVFPVHPHMLRHACGYKLANDGHDTRAIQHYLGHKNIQHTTVYTELASDRFNGFWKD